MPIVLSGSLELTGSIVSSGNLTTTGTITAQTLVVQTITSSIVNMTGSNIFGSQLTNRQTFTGSLYITGSSTQFSTDYVGINCSGIAGRTFVVKASTSGPTNPLEVVDCSGINSIYIAPNSGGTINLISSNYLTGGVYKSLAISNRECSTDFVLCNGCVAIGTNAPSSSLTIRSCFPRVEISSTNYTGLYKSFFGSLLTAQGILQLGNNSDNYILVGNTSAGGYLQFKTNVNADYGYTCGLEAFTIYCDASTCFAGPVKLAGAYASCLGLGTTSSPAKYLHIQGTNNFTQGIRFSEAGGNYPHNIYFGSSDSAACNWGLDFQVATASGTSATILSLRGNCTVGIGTTSPTALLHARGMANADVLYWLEPTSNAYASKLLLSSRSAGDGGIRYGCGGTNDMNIFSYGNMRFNVGTGNLGGAVTCQRMTIDTDGIVSISCQVCAYSFTATANPIAVEYLIVAGGGGGGWDVGGGGGAGGTLTGSTGLLPGTYPVGIGGGGAGSTNGSNNTRGYSTYAMGLIAVGGGPGGNYSGGSGQSGGSGGGGAGYGATTNAGYGMTGQGFAGGCGINVGSTNSTGGGGGGATGPGCISVSNLSGYSCGGPGILTTIIGATCSFACGGKGGGDNWGGMTAGPSNSGYGGDGAGVPNSGYNGASGVFVIKALNTNSISFSGGLTVTTCTNVGGYNIYVVTAGAGTMTIS